MKEPLICYNPLSADLAFIFSEFRLGGK